MAKLSEEARSALGMPPGNGKESEYDRLEAKIEAAIAGEPTQLVCECLNIVLIEQTDKLAKARGAPPDADIIAGHIRYGRWAGQWGGSGVVIGSDGSMIENLRPPSGASHRACMRRAHL